jgi:hypothetical protein
MPKYGVKSRRCIVSASSSKQHIASGVECENASSPLGRSSRAASLGAHASA